MISIIMFVLAFAFGLLAGIVGIWADFDLGRKLIMTATVFFFAGMFAQLLCMGFNSEE